MMLATHFLQGMVIHGWSDAVILFVLCFVPMWFIMSKVLKGHIFRARLFLVVCFSMIMMQAVTKGWGTVTYLRTDTDVQYFYDRGSYVTNDYVYVDFTTQVVPSSANFYGEYRELEKTNATDWVEFVNTTIGDFAPPQAIAFDNATNFNFRFYTDWTPGPSVVTNGVLHVNWGVPIVAPPPDSVIGLPVRTEINLEEEL